MKPLIGVTASPSLSKDGTSRVATLGTYYLEAVRAAGGLPVLLFDGENEAEALAARLDGLLLTGGDDVDPALFGEENCGSRDIDARRDALEIDCVRAFAAAGKPVLGICRGIQMLAVGLGGDLWQDIPSQTGIPHAFGSRHQIAIRPETFLHRILGTEATVNSTHHQAVRRLPQGFLAAAASPDGMIEAIADASGRRLWGVQFHPERLLAEQPAMVGIFRLLTAK